MLPFTPESFFEVFAAYNERLWPFAVGLWILTAYGFITAVRARPVRRRLISGILAMHWAWAGLAYHAAYFSAINPVAWAFSAFFILEAGLLAWYGVARGQLEFGSGGSIRRVLSFALILYGLMYPAIVRAEGHVYPLMPTFGVPCPTTILTIGCLMSIGRSLPPAVALVPIAWAFVGGSAALLLGVRADLMLAVGGILLAIDLLVRRCAVRGPSSEIASGRSHMTEELAGIEVARQ